MLFTATMLIKISIHCRICITFMETQCTVPKTIYSKVNQTRDFTPIPKLQNPTNVKPQDDSRKLTLNLQPSYELVFGI